MKIEKLTKLRNSSEAPFNHVTYTVWLHNNILDDIRHEVQGLKDCTNLSASDNLLLDKVLNLQSLQKIK